MHGCGPGRSPPRANNAAATKGTAEARILKRNMELPAHSGPDAKRAYGWRSVNKTGYRRVDGVPSSTRARIPAKPIAPESLQTIPPRIRGRRECRAPGAPVALRAKVKSTQASHHGHTGAIRHSPRNGFNGFLRGLPGEPGLL